MLVTYFFLVYYLISAGIQMCQQFAVDKVFAVVNNKKHDGLRHQISRCLRYDAHVTVDQVANGLDLTLQLWVNGAASSAARIV